MNKQQIEEVIDGLGITWVPVAHDRYLYAGKIWSRTAISELLIKAFHDRQLSIAVKPSEAQPLSELQSLLIWIRINRPCKGKMTSAKLPSLEAVVVALFGGDEKAFRGWLVDCLGKLLLSESPAGQLLELVGKATFKTKEAEG